MDRRSFIKNAVIAACVIALPVRAEDHLSRFKHLARLDSEDGLVDVLFAIDGERLLMSLRDRFFVPHRETTRIFTLDGSYHDLPLLNEFEALLERAPLIGQWSEGASLLGIYCDNCNAAMPFVQADLDRNWGVING